MTVFRLVTNGPNVPLSPSPLTTLLFYCSTEDPVLTSIQILELTQLRKYPRMYTVLVTLFFLKIFICISVSGREPLNSDDSRGLPLLMCLKENNQIPGLVWTVHPPLPIRELTRIVHLDSSSGVEWNTNETLTLVYRIEEPRSQTKGYFTRVLICRSINDSGGSKVWHF